MERQLPTFGELERDLSQKIQKLYREELKHSPQKVTSKFFDNKLVILVEGASTAVEQILINEHNDKNQMVENLNLAINNIIKPKFKTTIEAVLAVEVEDILFDSTIETKRTGAIVILSQVPQVRSPKSLWRIPKIQQAKRDNEQERDRSDDESLAAIAELEEPEGSNK